MLPKTTFYCAALLALACAAARADDDAIIPAPLPAAHYQKMAQHSPFSPATSAAAPVTVVAPVTAGWADKLKVTAIMQMGSRYLATVEDSATNDHFLVDSDKENDRGMILSGVQWSDKPSQMRVTLRHGAEFGQVSFDPNASMLAGGAPNASTPQQPNLPNPGGPPQIPGGGVIRPPAAPNFGMSQNPGNPNLPGPGSPGVMRRPPIRSGPPTINTPRVAPLATPAVSPAPGQNDDDDDD